jgi:hypothetical protein
MNLILERATGSVDLSETMKAGVMVLVSAWFCETKRELLVLQRKQQNRVSVSNGFVDDLCVPKRRDEIGDSSTHTT